MSTDHPRRIVADTGPIISLEKLTGGFEFIRRLYDEVVVPSAVMRELVTGQFDTTDEYLAHFNAAEVLVVQNPKGTDPYDWPDLDPGERAAIALAMDLGLDLLIEEEAGRREARRAGLHISGIAGQLLRAVRLDVVSSAEANSKLRELRMASRINRRLFEIVSAAIGNEV